MIGDSVSADSRLGVFRRGTVHCIDGLQMLIKRDAGPSSTCAGRGTEVLRILDGENESPLAESREV